MAMKAVVPAPPPSPPPPIDFSDMNMWNFNGSNCSTPYISAPSSPQRPLNFLFYSAPTTPRSSSSSSSSSSSVVPFNWEDKPGIPKSSINSHINDEDDEDFEFNFSHRMMIPSLSSADELFDGGKIRPLKPPPRLQISDDSPKSPKSPISKIRDAFSPKQRKHDFDPFEFALESTRKTEIPLKFDDENRGRQKKLPNSRVNSSRKGISRSLSPLRVSEFALINQDPSKISPQNSNNNNNRGNSRKWRLRDFLLFRSASEGRATTAGKDPLRKYFSPVKKSEEDTKNSSSFRSITMKDGGGSVSSRRGQVSAHGLHHRTFSEDKKKKTSLPYKHSFLGWLWS